MSITAAVLAGGKNSRIATEKSLLQISNAILIDRIVNLLEAIFPEVIIITGKDSLKNRFPEKKAVDDIFKDGGPLAGIHASLKTASYDAVFVFACDMPNLNSGLIYKMIDTYHAESTKPSLLVPRHLKGYEPLHAIYSKSILPVIEQQLILKNYKISSFYSRVTTTFFDVPDNFLPIFFNINTSKDLQEFQTLQNSGGLTSS